MTVTARWRHSVGAEWRGGKKMGDDRNEDATDWGNVATGVVALTGLPVPIQKGAESRGSSGPDAGSTC